MSCLRPEKIKALLKMAYVAAQESNDPSTQNAALLVDENGIMVAHDINRFPNKVLETKERWERPLKYKIIEHAERNVLYGAARNGTKTDGLIMICPWAACSDCARGIIQAGISILITHKQAHDRSPDFWSQEIGIAFQMLEEAGVEVIMYDGKIGVSNVLHSGEPWSP